MIKKKYSTSEERASLISDMSTEGKKLIEDAIHGDGNYLFFIDQDEVEPYVLTPSPPEPSETDILGQQLVEKDLQILELEQENQLLGSQIVDIDIRLLGGGL